jgi:capsular exopolysaccharide synthesis family protein
MAMQHKVDKKLVSLTAPASFAAEQYQGLRLTVERLRRSRDVRVIAVTSPGAGDGKTVTCINLAGALARGSDARVLLLDADLRRPAIATRIGLDDPGMGLAEAIGNERVSLDHVTQKMEDYNLSIITAGSSPASVHQILRSPHLEPFLQQARQRFDFVVLDTPPLIPVFDAAVLAKLVDGLLIVVSANRTPRKLLAEALNLLDPAKVLGIVFNNDERPMFGYYETYYRQYFPEMAGMTRA